MKDKKRILAIIAGIGCIVATASLMMLPATMSESDQNPYTETFEQLQTSEDKMLDMIAQEREQFMNLKQQVFSP